MIIYKDTLELNKEYPFSINRQILKNSVAGEDFFHWHSFCEITYVKKGRGYYYVNGEQYTMNAGDLIIFNHVEVHGWTVPEDSMELLVMVFARSFVEDPIHTFNHEYLQPFLQRGAKFRNKVEGKEPVTGQIGQLMEDILAEWQYREAGYRLMVKANVLQILTLLIRFYRREDAIAAGGEEKKGTNLEEAFYFINVNYTEKITLEDAARTVYMSPNYFSACFKKAAGVSFKEYLTRLRLLKANDLISTSDMQMAEIALTCGFPNISNFYRLYKKYHGAASFRRNQEEVIREMDDGPKFKVKPL